MLKDFDPDRINLSLDRLKTMASNQVETEIRKAIGGRLLEDLKQFAYYRLIEQLTGETKTALQAAETLASDKKDVLDAAAVLRSGAETQLKQYRAGFELSDSDAEKRSLGDAIGAQERIVSNLDSQWRLARIEFNRADADRAKLQALHQALASIPRPESVIFPADFAREIIGF